jgi:radical SAM protein with 4Fe4S-binding SPASM domain
MNTPFFGNQDHFTLHIRITKKCNADCSYCSSFQKNPHDLMSIENLHQSLKFIQSLIEKYHLGGKRKSITVQYIGGEILTVPQTYLKEFTTTVQNSLSPLFQNFRHGAQSNLIGSFQKVQNLYQLFDGNLGTSFEFLNNNRTIQKNHLLYKKIFFKNTQNIKKNFGKNISGIIVLDKSMQSYIFQEIEQAQKNKNHITIRPVFEGGSHIEELTIEEIEDIFLKIFEKWFLHYSIIIEPFYSYFMKRFLSKKSMSIENFSGCPSQHNCANVSLNLDPDGSLYICQDMSDSNQYKIGNALTSTFEKDLFHKIQQRSYFLEKNCLSCDYFHECQGGCMKEAIDHHNDIYGKTLYCPVWKKLFAQIDQKIKTIDHKDIENWLKQLEKY